jgi:hypothetical protein
MKAIAFEGYISRDQNGVLSIVLLATVLLAVASIFAYQLYQLLTKGSLKLRLITISKNETPINFLLVVILSPIVSLGMYCEAIWILMHIWRK